MGSRGIQLGVDIGPVEQRRRAVVGVHRKAGEEVGRRTDIGQDTCCVVLGSVWRKERRKEDKKVVNAKRGQKK